MCLNIFFRSKYNRTHQATEATERTEMTEATTFVIHGVKPGWDAVKTLEFISQVKASPKSLTEGACPRCRTRLHTFGCVEVSLCLICHIRFTWEKNPRILPAMAACHEAKHNRHRVRVHYTDTAGRDNYLLECTSCWIAALKKLNQPLVATEGELAVLKKYDEELKEEVTELRKNFDSLQEATRRLMGTIGFPVPLALQTKPADDKKQP